MIEQKQVINFFFSSDYLISRGDLDLKDCWLQNGGQQSKSMIIKNIYYDI